MQIHQLQPKHSNRGKKRVGRGGKKGTYSGKGNKGQSSRAGRKMVPMIRELIKRYPKLKGYRSPVLLKNTQIIQLSDIEKNIEDGQVVNLKTLTEKGLIQNHPKSHFRIKILGGVSITKKFTIENCFVSKSAKEAIEKAGGIIK